MAAHKGHKMTEENKRRLAPYQFKKGQSGNPSGRPSRKPLLQALKQLLRDNPDVERKLVERAVSEALDGDDRFWKELRDMLDGKPAQAIVAGTDDDGNAMAPPVVNVNFVSAPKKEKK